MIKAIIGTAGHIDHGKTYLLKALTGIDCDRLPEEKKREITIDLGFAYLKNENFQIGFIDVPGHEKFLKNLLAGIGGFQFFLFCISSDEGIKTQTIEHLKILKTLDLKKGIFALTKIDLVDGETLELRKMELEDLLKKEGFEFSKIVPVSALKEKNIDLLKEEIFKLIKENPPEVNLNLPTIFPVDRVFVISGTGVIITGTLVRGKLETQKEYFLLPLKKKVKIRGMEVHKEKRNYSEAVERVALNISGLEKGKIQRGDILTSQIFSSTKIITLKTNLLKEIKENSRLRIYHHTREVFGRFHHINKNFAQIFLEEELFAIRGDKVILRQYSPMDFLGSGLVLDIFLGKVKKDESFEMGKTLNEDINFWLKNSKEMGYNLENLIERAGFVEERKLKEILREIGAVEINKKIWDKESFEKLKERVLKNTKEFKEKNPFSSSIPLRIAFNFLEISEVSLQEISRAINLKVEKGNILLEKKEELSEDLIRVLKIWKEANLKQPDLEEISNNLKIPLDLLKKLIKELVQRGFLVQVSVNYYVERENLEKTIEKLKSRGWERFKISEFKELLNLSRKYAIPLLEYFDSIHLTIKGKDFRILKLK